mgnify:CR=1 FL=1
MDEIGDLVDEIKLDDQEEEKADASADGEEDMVFEETEGQADDSVESALDELGEEESTENSTEDASAGHDGSEESHEDSAADESGKVNEEEIVLESDDSENIEVSEESESSLEAGTEISDHIEYLPPISLSNFIMCLILYLDAFDSFAVIAINLFISPDHFIASLRVSIVSSVVNDFDEIIKSVSVFLRLEVFSMNSIGSEPVINR